MRKNSLLKDVDRKIQIKNVAGISLCGGWVY